MKKNFGFQIFFILNSVLYLGAWYWSYWLLAKSANILTTTSECCSMIVWLIKLTTIVLSIFSDPTSVPGEGLNTLETSLRVRT